MENLLSNAREFLELIGCIVFVGKKEVFDNKFKIKDIRTGKEKLVFYEDLLKEMSDLGIQVWR